MMPDTKTPQTELLANRLRKRQKHLGRWARRAGVEAYRLYDRDIPEIPLVLDVYGDAAALALYKRPYDKDEAEEERWLGDMKNVIAQTLAINEGRIFLRQRRRQRPGEQYSTSNPWEPHPRETPCAAAHEVVVADGCLPDGTVLRFKVNLADHVDTGLFLDSRPMRRRVYAEAPGKRVLNLFCYTGAFSVYAAAAGAASVDSVDLSRPYLAWAEANFRLNGLTPGGAFRFHGADVLRFLAQAAEEKRRWDIIILDPPTFSNSKKMSGTLDIRRDHERLIELCRGLCAENGVLYFSAKARSFKLSDDMREGAHEITEQLRDEDFRTRKLPPWFRFEGV